MKSRIRVVKPIHGGYEVLDPSHRGIIPAGEIVPFGLLERVAREGIGICQLPVFESWRERFPAEYKEMLNILCLKYADKMGAPFVEVRYLHDLRLGKDCQNLHGNLWCEAQLYVWNPAVRRDPLSVCA